MATTYARHVSTRQAPQSQPIPGSSQVANSAGGFAWQVDCWTRLDRFLILGNEGNSYYATEKELTLQASEALAECAQLDPVRTVNRIVEISVGGRAPKNAPAVFALAQLSKDCAALVEEAMPKVCRTGTDLFAFVEQARMFRGGGRALRRTIGRWYTEKAAESLAYQLAKYQQRNGWSHKDVLSLARPKLNSQVIRWAMGLDAGERNVKRCRTDKSEIRTDHYAPVASELPKIITGMEAAKVATNATEIVRLIRESGLVRECIPTQFLNSAEVWDALLEKMPLTAMIRNLGKMSTVGLLKPLSNASKLVCERLADAEYLHKSRVHPVAVLMALKVYGAGRGVRGGNAWSPVSQVVDALDGAFYKAFANVEPTGKRWLLALDVSGSMDMGTVAGVPDFTPRQASAAMALVTAASEPQHAFVAFTSANGRMPRTMAEVTSGLTPLAISPRQRLDDVVRMVQDLPMGGTDCALPMLYALEQKIPVDVFVTYTDSESWANPKIHASQALVMYRQKMGINAKAICVGMVANDYTVLDPNDAGSLNVSGFDANVPAIMAQFVAG